MLPRAIRSVLSQTFEDLELIVVDDHSDDHTPQVLAGCTDKRVISLRHARNMGQSKALNTGINAARGKYVALLDDDDAWLPDKLALQVAVLDAAPAKVGLVYGWRHIMDHENDSLIRTVRHTLSGDIREHMLGLDTPVPPSSWLMRTSVVRVLGGFDERVHRAKDIEFFCRFCEEGWHVDYVPRVVLLKYLHTAGQMVDETPENLKVRCDFIRCHLAKFDVKLRQRPETRARVFLELAHLQLPYQRLMSSMSMARAFLVDPEKWTKKTSLYSRRFYYMLRDATRRPGANRHRQNDRAKMPSSRLY